MASASRERELAYLHGGQGDVAHYAQVWEEVELLEYHPHFPPNGVYVADVLRHLEAVDYDVAPLVLIQPVDRADESGLAGPRRSDYHHYLAPGD